MKSSDSASLEVCLRLFPMVLCLDSTGTIHFVSDRLIERIGNPLGENLFEIFTFNGPVAKLARNRRLGKEHIGALFLLHSERLDFAVRGQLLEGSFEGREAYILVCSPWLSWLNDNDSTHRVSVKDFPVIDSQLEYQISLVRQKSMLSDLERFSKSLETAIVQAEAASNAKTRFVRHVSHEIRTPLNGIISSINLLKDETSEAGRSRLTGIAESCAVALMDLVNEVLDFSRIEEGVFVRSIEDIRIRRLMSEITGALSARSAEKGIHLQFDIDYSVPEWIRTDRKVLLKIFFNLIGNAIKYSESDLVVIRLDSQPLDVQNSILTIEVEDYGVGIPEDLLDEIFEPFSTSTNTSSNEFSTGLGLYIVKELVENLGGTIQVSSIVDHGACFTIQLPVQILNNVAAEGTARPAAKAESGRFSGTVLVVDDNVINLELARMQLSKLGIAVTAATNGRQALELAQLQDFDMIIMDVNMPIMGGVEATGEIRKSGRNRAVPIIAFTANVATEDLQAYTNSGMNDVLTKPVSRDAMVRLCRAYTRPISDEKEELPQESARLEDLVLDSDQLHALIDEIGVENASSIVTMFISETEKQIEELIRSARQRDYQAVVGIAHRVASSSLSFGLKRLGARLRQIESESKAGAELTQSELNGLDSLLDTSITELKNSLKIQFSQDLQLSRS